MMNFLRRLIFLSIITLTLHSLSYAQSYVESALMFGRTMPGGSARIQGLGGTQVSLGGDYSSAFSNPAGLGMFNKSEISITPGITGFTNQANFLGNKNKESASRFQIPGLSLVLNHPSGRDEGGFIGGSFAITLNRVNDFRGEMFYEGANNNSSIIESFIAQANGQTTAQFERVGRHYNTPTGLAYYNFLIGPASNLDESFPDDEYFTDVQKNFEELTSPSFQREEVSRKGAMNQWSFSYGANFKDIFFVGGGLGVSSIRYQATNTFYERYENDELFNNLRLVENIDIRGSGVNATLGTIVRPVYFLQLGFSYTTPTYFQLTDTYSASMNTSWRNFDYYGDGKTILNDESAATDIVTSEYNLTIPSKLSGGVSFITKYGFISGDIEYTNPSRSRYSSETSGVSYSPENQDIRDVYSSVLNYRIGSEGRIGIWRIRAGYGIQGNAFDRKLDLNNRIRTVSGGAGVRLKTMYIDFALINQQTKYPYQPYNIYGEGPVVDVTRNRTSGMITLGFFY